MAIKALNLHDLKTISHPTDKKNPTKFTIGAIDSRVYGQLSDRSLVVAVDGNNPDADADVKMARNQLAFEVVQFGLKGFENFCDDKGEIKFTTERKTVGSRAYDVANSDILSVIPGTYLSWLAEQIMSMNSLEITEGKT